MLPQAEKVYRRLFLRDRALFERIYNALQALKAAPHIGKGLKDKLKGKYSVRVGVYRIIYSIEKQEVTVYVFDIGHRREIYR